MSNLEYWQSKIQEKRKQTPFREFVMEICSWRPMSFYKTKYGISKYPQGGRVLSLLSVTQYLKNYIDGQSTDNNKDFSSTSFLGEFETLYSKINHPTLLQYGMDNINCEYGDTIRNGGKDIYLSIVAGDGSSNIFYSNKAETNVHYVFNSLNVTSNSEQVYYCKSIRNTSLVFYSQYVYDSSNIRFSSNLVGCHHCIGCNNLENKSYCINNTQLSKEEYEQQSTIFLNDKSKFDAYRIMYLKGGGIKVSQNSSGDGIFQCNNVENGYEVSYINSARNILHSDGGNDSAQIYDSYDVATDNTHHVYGTYGQAFGDHIYCCAYINGCLQTHYSYFMENCSFCLGCIGLKNKQFCILNKQYTKEEWYKKVDEIFAQMESDGTLGQFFPASMNPFYFNDTAAYLIDPSFTKEEVTAKGYLWRNEPIKVDIPEGAEIIKVEELNSYEGFDDSGNWVINKDILKKIIQDEQGNYYRIIPTEHKFLMKHGLPLPRKHWLDRMRENFYIH